MFVKFLNSGAVRELSEAIGKGLIERAVAAEITDGEYWRVKHEFMNQPIERAVTDDGEKR